MVMWIIGMGWLFAVPALIPDGWRLSAYRRLFYAAPFLTWAYCLYLFVKEFHAGDGAPTTVAIVPLGAGLIGGLFAIAGLGFLIAFLRARPLRGYLALLAFLPCIWIAKQPSDAERYKKEDANHAAAMGSYHARQRGAWTASQNDFFYPEQCRQSLRGEEQTGCLDYLKKSASQAKFAEKFGKYLANTKHLTSDVLCSTLDAPEVTDKAALISGCESVFRASQLQ